MKPSKKNIGSSETLGDNTGVTWDSSKLKWEKILLESKAMEPGLLLKPSPNLISHATKTEATANNL